MKTVAVGDCSLTIRERDGRFLGLGAVEIAGRLVRSGRLPWLPWTQTFDGLEMVRFRLAGVACDGDGVVVVLRPEFRACGQALRRDRNLTPLLATADWDAGDGGEPGGELRLLVQPDRQQVGECLLTGFSYSWKYTGPHALHQLLDRCSWELDGDIRGATVVSQTGWIPPVARFDGDNGWTSELGHELQAWPRWAVMQGFDFQARDDGVLCGLFARVGLIRSILRREPGAAELKVLDLHLADAATGFASVPKRILLAPGRFGELDWRNLWSDLLDYSNELARGEFGLREVPAEPFLQQDFWGAHTFEDYRRDLLPAAAAIGVGYAAIGNVNRSAASEGTQGNQCCSHAYEPAPSLGGIAGLKRLVADARALGVRLRSWTSTAQGFDSPLYQQHRQDAWFLRQEDGGQTHGSVHDTDFHCLDLSHAPARRLWLEALLRIRTETGLDAWFLDMFANVSFMPLGFADGRPRTMWRACLEALAELQRAGIDCDGGAPAFVRPLPGGHAGYRAPEDAFVNLRLYIDPADASLLWTPGELHAWLALGTVPTLPLRLGGQRIDAVWTPQHRAELDLFRRLRPLMHRRRLLDGGVEWTAADGRQRLVLALAPMDLRHDGEVEDMRSCLVRPRAASHALAVGDAVLTRPG